jgi:glycosyltransferase involved in cell wall biosynthesis
MTITSTRAVTDLLPRPLRALTVEPLVSILLANYNYAAYIGTSIESVLDQTYRNWELIVCDDGSTDESVHVIERYLAVDSRIRLLRKPNGGHTSALNAAFTSARGDIICFLDSDDLFLPGKLEAVVNACGSSPEAGFIAHAVIRVDAQRQRQGVWPLSVHADGWLGTDLLKAGGILPFAPPTSGIALRREIAESVFPISMVPPLHMCPDQVIVRLAPLITLVRRLPEALSEYRLHNANSYAAQGVTIDSIAKQLNVSRALWGDQHRFLSGMNPEIARQLSVPENSPYIALLQYLEAS